MDVKEVRCYNKDLNKFMRFNEHIIDERFMKSTGYRPVIEPTEEPIMCGQTLGVTSVETVTPCLDYPAKNTSEPELLCKEVKTRSRKIKK